MRIHRFVLIAVIASLSVVVVRAATHEERTSSRAKASSPASADAVTVSDDCCIEAVESNFPMPPLSARGNHCPSDQVPQGSENVFITGEGRLEISFFDAASGKPGTFILDITDPACFEHSASRAALFGELVIVLQNDPSVSGEEERACASLKQAIYEGSLTLDGRSFDLRVARPYINEVCPYS